MIAMQTVISLAGLLCLMVLYNDYRVDRLRQDLFAVRDDLFDEARTGTISFDSDAYVEIRAMCNGLIRFGHTVSLLDFLMFVATTSRETIEEVNGAMDRFIGSMSANDREVALRYVDRANRAVVEHLARSPFILVTVLLPLVFLVATRSGKDLAALAVRQLKKPLQSLDRMAIGEGLATGESAFVA
jgi:hypothetical protein